MVNFMLCVFYYQKKKKIAHMVKGCKIYSEEPSARFLPRRDHPEWLREEWRQVASCPGPGEAG